MIYGLLLTLFVIACFALILLVLIQKGKGSMGLGSMGGGTTMLFGGSGGQDFFQKLTWVLGAILMGGSLILGLMKSSSLHNVRFLNIKEEAIPAGEALAAEKAGAAQTETATAQEAPATPTAEATTKQPEQAKPEPAKPAQQ